MAETPNVNPTPRQEFHANAGWIKMHREMMQQPMLQVSIQFALAQYVRQFADSRAADATTAAQNFYRLEGAHEFIKLLRNLAEMPAPPPPKRKDNQLTQI